MKPMKNVRSINTRRLFNFEQNQASGYDTTDPTSITINTNTGTTATTVTYGHGTNRRKNTGKSH